MSRNPIQRIQALRIVANFFLGLIIGFVLLMFVNTFLFWLVLSRNMDFSLSIGPLLIVESVSNAQGRGLVWGGGAIIILLGLALINVLLTEWFRKQRESVL